MKSIISIIMTSIVALGFLTEAYAVPTSQAAATKSSNAARTVHFAVSYNFPIGGNFTCSGERIVKLAPTAFTKDSEECTITNLSTFPPGTYVGNPFFVVNNAPIFWISDFDGKIAKRVTVVVTNNGDGTGNLKAVAYY